MGENFCCDETGNTIINQVKAILVNKELWITVNGVTGRVDLSSLSTGGGGEIPSEYPHPVDLQLSIQTNGQVQFNNVIPENAIVVELIVNGVVYNKDLSFTTSGANLTWINTTMNLEIGDTVILKTWQL